MLKDTKFKACTLNLTDEQIKTLTDLIAPSAGWEDEPDINYGLLSELERAASVARTADPLYYINEYEVTREYGGPEEGGWYYTVYRLHRSAAFDNHVAAIDEAVNYLRDVEFISMDEYRHFCTDEYNDLVNKLIDPTWCEFGMQLWSNMDKYGDGIILAIEPTPGCSDNTHVHQYYH